MDRKSLGAFGAMLFLVCAIGAPLQAGEDVQAESDEAADDGRSHEINVDLGWASAYVFRGANVFGADQQDQHGVFSPGIAWNIHGSGLTLGYWGAFQLNGSNRQANVDSGLGAEQDIYLAYEWSLLDTVTLYGAIYYYFYPAADEAQAGSEWPNYIEPFLGATASMMVDLGLKVSYLAGLQEVVRADSYVYINPTIAKNYDLLPILSLFWGVGYGYKIWHADHAGDENTHDVQLDLGVTADLFDTLYVTPAVHLAWTNTDMENSDGFIFWGGINAGLNL